MLTRRSREHYELPAPRAARDVVACRIPSITATLEGVLALVISATASPTTKRSESRMSFRTRLYLDDHHQLRGRSYPWMNASRKLISHRETVARKGLSPAPR